MAAKIERGNEYEKGVAQAALSAYSLTPEEQQLVMANARTVHHWKNKAGEVVAVTSTLNILGGATFVVAFDEKKARQSKRDQRGDDGQ